MAYARPVASAPPLAPLAPEPPLASIKERALAEAARAPEELSGGRVRSGPATRPLSPFFVACVSSRRSIYSRSRLSRAKISTMRVLCDSVLN